MRYRILNWITLIFLSAILLLFIFVIARHIYLHYTDEAHQQHHHHHSHSR